MLIDPGFFSSSHITMGTRIAAEILWKANGLSEESLSRLLLSKNPDPSVDSSLKLGTAAQVRKQTSDDGMFLYVVLTLHCG